MLPDPETAPTVAVWPAAGKALGMGRSACYAAIAQGTFPVAVLRCGGRYRVPTAELRRVLGLSLSPGTPAGASRP